jgi:2-keto-4-pentenoate hydratase/2-oxohepta-3-ene-1,7-dioic acid hydratase in catechol pathway
MKLIRWRSGNKTQPGILLDGSYYDVSSFGEDYNEAFFETDGLSRLRGFLQQQSAKLMKLDEPVNLDSPIARPSKIVCIGLNYLDHARETKYKPPTEPVIFLKSIRHSTDLDPVIIPKNSKTTGSRIGGGDGKKASYVRIEALQDMSPAIACTMM